MLAQVIYLFSWPVLIIATLILARQAIKYWEKRYGCHEDTPAQ